MKHRELWDEITLSWLEKVIQREYEYIEQMNERRMGGLSENKEYKEYRDKHNRYRVRERK